MNITRAMIENLQPYFYLYNKKIKDLDSNILRTYFQEFSLKESEKLINSFQGNRGVVSDGSTKEVYPRIFNEEYKEYGLDFAYNESFCRIITNLSLKEPFRFDPSNPSQETQIKIIEKLSQKEIVPILSFAEVELPYIHVYMNGKKIQDRDVLVYPSSSYLDVFIPVRYVNQFTKNELFIEKIETRTDQYISRFFKDANTKKFDVILSEREYNNINIQVTKKMNLYADGHKIEGKGTNAETKTISLRDTQSAFIQILETVDIVAYIDGLMQRSEVKTIKFVKNILPEKDKTTYKIQIETRKTLSGDVELIYRPDIYKRQRYTIHQLQKIPFYIAEGIARSLYGPLSEVSSSFFLNGQRIPEQKMTQIGRVHYKYEPGTTESGIIDVIYSDKDIDNNTFYPIYYSDYYLYEMIGHKASAFRSIKDTSRYKTETILDESDLDYDEIFRTNELEYNTDQNIKRIAQYADLFKNRFKKDGESDSDFYYKYAKELITDHPYLTRIFLENFQKDNRQLTIKKPNPMNDVLVTGVTDPQLGEGIIITAFVNGVLAHHDYTVVTDDAINAIKSVTIDYHYFTEDSNHVEVIWYRRPLADGQGIQKLTISHIGTNGFVLNSKTNEYTFTTSSFKHVDHAKDLILLESVSGGIENLYYDSKQTGYRPVRSKLYTITLNDNGSITVILNFIPTKNYTLYCKRFIYKIEKTMPQSGERLKDNLFIPLLDEQNIPIYSVGSPIVVADNKVLYNNYDFLLRNYDSFKHMTYSGIVIKKRLTPGTKITIYFTPFKNRNILYDEHMSLENEFALLYLNRLNIPYSPQYLDIYIDYKKLSSDEVKQFSDKLIRFPKEKLPVVEVFIRTNFKIDVVDSQFKEFIDHVYPENKFEKNIKNWFSRFDPMSPVTSNEYDAQKIFENFITLKNKEKKNSGEIETIIRNLKNKLRKITDSGGIVASRLDPLLQAWLNLVNRHKIDPIINQIEPFDSETSQYLKLFDETPDDDNILVQLIFDSPVLYERFVMSHNNYRFRHSDRSYFQGQSLSELDSTGDKAGKFGSIEQSQLYKKSKYEKEVYQRDIVPMSSHNSITTFQDDKTVPPTRIILGRGLRDKDEPIIRRSQ